MRFLLAENLLLCVGTCVVLGVNGINGEKRLIKTSLDKPAQWLDEGEIANLFRNGEKFMDWTDFEYRDVQPPPVNAGGIPTELRFQETVRAVSSNLNTPRAQEFLTTLSGFPERVFNSSVGRLSQLWLFRQVEESIKGYAGTASVVEFEHDFFQRSVIARLEGADPELKDEVIIIGSHLDSKNYLNYTWRAPGANDDGSGSVAVIETLRAIVESGLILKKTAEFHWYAAEEEGMRGSLDVAAAYRKEEVKVDAMLQFDVIGHHKPGIDFIGITGDGNVNPIEANFLRILTDEYLIYRRRDKTCGFACSDHDSWHLNGYPAGLVMEVIGHNYMHTEWDTIDTVDFAQIAEFIKLAIGFLVEIAEPLQELPLS